VTEWFCFCSREESGDNEAPSAAVRGVLRVASMGGDRGDPHPDGVHAHRGQAKPGNRRGPRPRRQPRRGGRTSPGPTLRMAEKLHRSRGLPLLPYF